jgi:hypothetical protein
VPARPASIRLDDLAAPRFPEAMTPLLEGMTAMAPQCVLEPDALCETAVAQAGLDDFGDPSFRGRLAVLCTALREDITLTPPGLVNVWSLLVQLLKNRLLIEDVIARHPEIEDVEIRAPIVIAGLPRTGTTHLHNLIAADPALRSLPYWESLEPVLPGNAQPLDGAPDPRVERTDFALGVVNGLMPEFKRMHEMTVEHVHEEIQLLAIDFSSMLFETTALLPTWRDWYMAADQTPHYEYLRRVLKVLQWLRGGSRWVLKSPQHLEQFGPLRKTFPDATFVVTHRDPVSVTVSVVTMLAYTARMHVAAPDLHAIGRYWADRVESFLAACVRDRELLPAEQSIDVPFDEFMANDVRMVERIYAIADQPFTPAVRAAMEAFMIDHPRGRHGGVLYDLSEFGLDAQERREALRFYSDRFAVTPET